MDTKNIISKSTTRKTIKVQIRITPATSKWMRAKNYSPTGIFEEALRQLECPYRR